MVGSEGNLLARLEALESRVEVAESVNEITRTLYLLAHTLDYGDNAAWVDCFTPDAVFEMVEVNETERGVRVRHTDRAALAAFIPGHSHAPEHFHKHLVADPVIVVSQGQATCESYMTRIDKGTDGPYFWSFGRYLDKFMRSEDGKWRVSQRIIEVESRFQPVKAADIGSRS